MSSVGTDATAPPAAKAAAAAGTASRKTRRSATNGSAPVAHASVAERIAHGKAARAQVPRSSHAAFEPPSRRGDPVKLLERQAKTRVPELVPIRYGRMLVSPFTFYRGAAMIMLREQSPTTASGCGYSLRTCS